mgnify:CR=1 FL=1
MNFIVWRRAIRQAVTSIMRCSKPWFVSYPDDATANLNASNVAMSRGDLVSARKYVAKAGGTPEAVYARGVLAGTGQRLCTGHAACCRQAQSMGVKEAADALEQINKIDKK